MTSVESIPAYIETETLRSIDDLSKSKKKKRFWENLTMEPVLGTSMIAITFAMTAFPNANLQRACMIDLGYSEDVCVRGIGSEKLVAELSSQKLIAQISILRGFISGSLTACVMMFLGPWSDYSRRRKPLVLLSVGGMAVAYLNTLIMLMLPKLSVIWLIYFEMVPMALSGGFALMFISSFSHLGDICYKTGRDATTLMGMNSAVVQACTVLGSLCGPFVYRMAGLKTVFFCSLLLQIVSFLYAWRMMKDVNEPIKNVRLFDINLPLTAFRTMFKKRDGSKRKVLMLMVAVSLTQSFLVITEMVNMYMYLRNRFGWTEVEFGIFSSYKSVIGCLSTIFVIRVFKDKLRLSDTTLGVIGTVSHGIVVAIFALASSSLQIFLAPIVGIFQSSSSLVHKPIMNKQIESDEQGKINSVISVMDTLVHLVASPASSALYAATVSTIPGLYLLPCVIVSFLQTLCFTSMIEYKITLPAVIFSSMYMYYMSQYQ